jgi:anti-sigma factor RsiW
MSHCEGNISRLDLFLDDELRGGELEVFNRHIRECSSCREELIEHRRFLEQIRAARPLYSVSPELRREVAAILGEPAGSGTVQARSRPVTRITGKNRAWLGWLSSRPIPALAAFMLAIAVVTILSRLSLTEARANAFVDMAAQTHRQQLAGQLPLEVQTNSPSEISAWFADKVPFQFRLPTYQEVDGQAPKYELTGGTLVGFKGGRAAYISYRMGAQTISLVLISASSSVAAGGDKTVSKSLTFHAHRRDDLQVVTWSVHNLTYGLVSAVSLPISQSCVVCHASANDKKLIQYIKGRVRPETNRKYVDASEPAGHLRGGIPIMFDIRNAREYETP